MGSQIIRAMTKDGSARVVVINSTDIVNKADEYHKLTPTTLTVLGRLLTAASMIGSLMQEKQESITIGINGNGPVGKVLCVSDYFGNVKGYMENPNVNLPLTSDGKIDTPSALGSGILYTVHDFNTGKPQTGMVELESGEIANDIAKYFAESEQVPTVCSLGITFNEKLKCKAAGGVLIQLMPFPEESTIEKLENNANHLSSMSNLLAQGKTLKDIMDIALDGIEYDLFDGISVGYKCDCSKTRMKRKMKSLGDKQLSDLFDEQEKDTGKRELETKCLFCNKTYAFNENDLDLGGKSSD